jgi:hypothetical protein
MIVYLGASSLQPESIRRKRRNHRPVLIISNLPGVRDNLLFLDVDIYVRPQTAGFS